MPEDNWGIGKALGGIDAKLDRLIDSQNKVVLALIAVIGATLGLKFTSTPPIIVILFYTKTFIFIFAILLAISKRKALYGWQFILGFGIFAGVAQVLSILFMGETATSTSLFLLANLSLLLFVWKCDNNIVKEKGV